jgi:hypothetical protein
MRPRIPSRARVQEILAGSSPASYAAWPIRVQIAWQQHCIVYVSWRIIGGDFEPSTTAAPPRSEVSSSSKQVPSCEREAQAAAAYCGDSGWPAVTFG